MKWTDVLIVSRCVWQKNNNEDAEYFSCQKSTFVTRTITIFGCACYKHYRLPNNHLWISGFHNDCWRGKIIMENTERVQSNLLHINIMYCIELWFEVLSVTSVICHREWVGILFLAVNINSNVWVRARIGKTSTSVSMETYIQFLCVLAHKIGNVLGLRHSSVSKRFP